MNNSRNNRRRGRGNRSQGGGNSANRVDSRARGNAPQLLDKYKKLAQDAHHNGDRVQMEHYLQFADHYFRVIADNKTRQEEARAKRQEERDRGIDETEDDYVEEGRRNRRFAGKRNGRADDTYLQAEDRVDDNSSSSESKPNHRRSRNRDDD